MSDETRRILDLLAHGKVTVEEADELLRAVGARPADRGAPPVEPTDRPPARYLRIAVLRAGDTSRPEKQVSFRVPVSLLKSGMRLGALIQGNGLGEIGRRLREQGIDLDPSNLDPEHLDSLMRDLGEVTMDVDGGRARVRITCE